MHRAYATIEIKAVDEDDRTIEGIASTPSSDRMSDVVMPLGAKFALPLPLLWQHRHDMPIGHVTWAKATKDGIPFKAKLVHPDQVESPELKNRLQLAWDSITSKLVRAVSIGFRSIKEAWDRDRAGFDFLEWEWLELSAVTIPANQDASITTIRSIDTETRAAEPSAIEDDPAQDPSPPREPAATGKKVHVAKLNPQPAPGPAYVINRIVR